MSRSAAVTFKGNPMTLAGEAVQVGQSAPDFQLHYYEGGLKTLKLVDLKGKPAIISVVPSLDTPVCQTQTKRFNQELGVMGDKVHASPSATTFPSPKGVFVERKESATFGRRATTKTDRSVRIGAC